MCSLIAVIRGFSPEISEHFQYFSQSEKYDGNIFCFFFYTPHHHGHHCQVKNPIFCPLNIAYKTIVSFSSDSMADSEHLDKNGKPIHVTLFAMRMKRDTAYYIVDFLCILLFVISFVIVAVSVEWDAYIWRFYVGFGCLMILCLIISEVNHRNKFKSMTAWFNQWRYTLVIAFFILALGDFILLELSDVPDDCDFDDPNLVKTLSYPQS